MILHVIVLKFIYNFMKYYLTNEKELLPVICGEGTIV